MNAFPIVKSFTAVVVFLVALNGWSQKEVSREKCIADKLLAYNENENTCLSLYPKKDEIDKKKICNDERAEKAKSECADNDPISSIRTNCTAILKDYEKTAEELDSQCKQADTEKVPDCKKKAASCAKSLNVGGFGEDGEDDSETERIMKAVYGIAKSKIGAADSVASDNTCTYQENEKEQDRSEQKIEKISKLKADIASLKEDAAKVDDDVAKKKQDVSEEILKLEKEVDKKTAERKTEAQRETVKMQQDAIESVKRKKAAVDAMDEKNTEIANLRITQQEEAIKFSESNLMKACRDQALELKGKLIESATKAAASSNQGTATTGNIKKDVETFAKQCIKLAAVERNKAIKSTQDKITRANRSVSNYKDVIKQEGESFAIRQKDIEAREKLANEEQTQAEDKKTKELTQLNQKVEDIQVLAEKKKATFAEKIKVKEDEFNAIQLKMQNMQPKFSKISATIRTSGRKAGQFIDQCCGTGTKFKDTCKSLDSDFGKTAAEKREEERKAKKEAKQKSKT